MLNDPATILTPVMKIYPDMRACTRIDNPWTVILGGGIPDSTGGLPQLRVP
jgi:hypothetical protein